jgi:hypothetical protein
LALDLLNSLLHKEVDLLVHLILAAVDQDEATCEEEKNEVALKAVVGVLELARRRHELKYAEGVENNKETQSAYEREEEGPPGDLLRRNEYFDIDYHNKAAEHKVSVERRASHLAKLLLTRVYRDIHYCTQESALPDSVAEPAPERVLVEVDVVKPDQVVVWLIKELLLIELPVKD